MNQSTQNKYNKTHNELHIIYDQLFYREKFIQF